MSTDERKLRENRRRNLIAMLEGPSGVSPKYLADKLGCVPNHVSQLKIGNRPITFETARRIEEVVVPRMVPMSLDDPPTSGEDVSALTDSELRERVSLLLAQIVRERKQKPLSDIYDAMLRLCFLNARQRGFSEARIRLIAKEFLS